MVVAPDPVLSQRAKDNCLSYDNAAWNYSDGGVARCLTPFHTSSRMATLIWPAGGHEYRRQHDGNKVRFRLRSTVLPHFSYSWSQHNRTLGRAGGLQRQRDRSAQNDQASVVMLVVLWRSERNRSLLSCSMRTPLARVRHARSRTWRRHAKCELSTREVIVRARNVQHLGYRRGPLLSKNTPGEPERLPR